MSTIRFIVFLIALLFITYKNAITQVRDYTFTHYTKEDGLPTNTIYGTVTDHDGILWIGTDAGLVRFDGAHFKIYTISDGLPSNDVFELFCDSENKIWIKTMSTDVAYIQNNKIHNPQNDKLLFKIKVKKRVVRIQEIKGQGIFILSFPSEIIQIKNDTIIKYNIEKRYWQISNIFVYNNQLLCISTQNSFVFKNKMIIDSSHNKINIDGIVIKNDTCYYLKNSKLLKSHISTFLNHQFIAFHSTWTLFLDNKYTLWKLCDKGISNTNIDNIANFKLYLKDESVSFYSQDSNNNNWISTIGGGLYNIKVNNSKIYFQNEYLHVNKYRSILFHKNIIYLGTDEGKILVIDRITLKNKKTILLNLNAFISFRILKILMYNQNELLISTDIGYYIYKINSGQTTKITYFSCKNNYIEKDTSIILTSWGLLKYNFKNDYKDSIIHNKRMYSYINYNNETLIGGEDSLYKLVNKKFTQYQLNKPLNSRVMDMITKDSMLILATINSGIYFIKNHTIIRQINTKNGLSSNNCFKIIPYKNDYYIATNNGISIYNYQKNSIHNLYESDGLSSNTVNDIAIDKDTLYAATENGLSIISIANIDTNKHFILFNKPTIIGKDTLWTSDSLFTTHTDLPFLFTLNSLSYNTKGNVEYYYKINQNNFITTKDQLINLSFPNPGNYEFEAFAKDKNGNISNTIKLKINAVPYFYQTIWFKIFCIILVVLLLYILFKYLLHQSNKKEIAKRELDTKIHNLELSAWRSKINPHFLFNSLNVLHFLFLDNDEEKANTYMQNFSSVLRKTIDNSGKLLNTVSDECAYIEEYMKLETIKRKNNFSFNIDYQKDALKKFFIPSMLLQPVLENSLKHGIRENLNGDINIHFYEKDAQLICEVTDNGRGFENYNTIHTEHKSVGIELIEDKIKIIEKIIHQKILFSFNTRFNEKNESVGSITTFIFPIITKDITND